MNDSAGNACRELEIGLQFECNSFDECNEIVL